MAVAECEAKVTELSDGWHVEIDLNVIRSERTTIQHGPHASPLEAQQWVENRLERHATIEANRMQRILKELGADQ